MRESTFLRRIIPIEEQDEINRETIIAEARTSLLIYNLISNYNRLKIILKNQYSLIMPEKLRDSTFFKQDLKNLILDCPDKQILDCYNYFKTYILPLNREANENIISKAWNKKYWNNIRDEWNALLYTLLKNKCEPYHAINLKLKVEEKIKEIIKNLEQDNSDKYMLEKLKSALTVISSLKNINTDFIIKEDVTEVSLRRQKLEKSFKKYKSLYNLLQDNLNEPVKYEKIKSILGLKYSKSRVNNVMKTIAFKAYYDGYDIINAPNSGYIMKLRKK